MTPASPNTVKQELTRRVEAVTAPAFLEKRLFPYLPSARVEAPRTRVIQLDGTGAATVEVRANGGLGIFVKLYPDHHAGADIYDKLVALRSEGFGAGDRYQAVEPLEFEPELQMLITREAGGTAASSYIGGDQGALVESVRESAAWLAKLHTWPGRIGKPHSLLVSGELLSLAKRASKMVAGRPEFLEGFLDMLGEMDRLAEDTSDGIIAQCHGQFRPIHVFVGDAVTVIDLDRSRPSDPARDVAEYVHRLRMTTFWHHTWPQGAEEPTRVFLDTYRSMVPGTHLTNLRFHWARYVFHSLNRKLKDADARALDVDGTIQFYRSEFEGVISGWYGI